MFCNVSQQKNAESKVGKFHQQVFRLIKVIGANAVATG